MTRARHPHVGLPVLAGLLLAAATPPAWFPFAEWLVLGGLAAWFAVATDTRRPLWHTYVLGCVHMAVFSWSVRHVLWIAYAVIIVAGGVYYVAATAATRAAAPRWRTLAFALAVAGSFWLRANMPEIWYPHGQPSHALWQWPVWLHTVVVGGEALANVLLAALAATAVELARSWRVAIPAWPVARRNVVIAAVLFVATPALGHVLRVRPEPGAGTVDVAAIEPGFHLMHELLPLPRAQRDARHRELLATRLLAPTRALATATLPPDVILWPESSLWETLDVDGIAAGRHSLLPGAWPASASRVLLGANVERLAPLPTPAALLLELPSGRVLAHQEKRCLVPGGEFQPFLGWLPRFASDAVRAWFAQAMNSMPEAATGVELPPLRGPRDVPFGALLCYDNAFPHPATAQVERGARWLAVLSNESWYEGGGELVQLQAMTVLRAIETGTPIVRCTQDGWSGVIGADGRVLASLPPAPAPQPDARILRVEIEPGPGRVPPLASLRLASGPCTALALAALLAHAFVRRARLRAARTTSRSASTSGDPEGGRGSGS